jgi:hypothetical protein
MHAKILEVCRSQSVTPYGTAYHSLKLWAPAAKPNIGMEREERRHFEREFIDWIEDLGTRKICDQPLWKFQKCTKEQRGPEPDVHLILKSLYKVFRNHMKLITTAESLIGLGHAHVESGDRVCYIAGCSYPVVLRPIIFRGQVAYHLIGGAELILTMGDPRQEWNRLESTETFDII